MISESKVKKVVAAVKVCERVYHPRKTNKVLREMDYPRGEYAQDAFDREFNNMLDESE